MIVKENLQFGSSAASDNKGGAGLIHVSLTFMASVFMLSLLCGFQIGCRLHHNILKNAEEKELFFYRV